MSARFARLYIGWIILLDLGLSVYAHCGERTRPQRPPLPIAWDSAYMTGFPGAPDTIGYVCATGPMEAYSAAHVFDGNDSMEWRQGINRGLMKVMQRFKNRDLVKVVSDAPFPVYSPIAKAAPYQGDTLWAPNRLWFDDSLPIFWPGTVLGMDSEDDLIMLGPAIDGGSGGCAWNTRGEVVGIEYAFFKYESPQVPHRRRKGRDPAYILTAMVQPLWGAWRE